MLQKIVPLNPPDHRDYFHMLPNKGPVFLCRESVSEHSLTPVNEPWFETWVSSNIIRSARGMSYLVHCFSGNVGFQ